MSREQSFHLFISRVRCLPAGGHPAAGDPNKRSDAHQEEDLQEYFPQKVRKPSNFTTKQSRKFDVLHLDEC